MSNNNDYLLPVRMDSETRKKMEQWSDPGDRSEFVRKAIHFYADSLAIDQNELLPRAITTAIDGRLSLLEKRISSIAFRQALAQDMTNGILSDAFSFTRDDLKRRRAESVKNVKQTNGFISLEKRTNDGNGYDFDGDDEAWQE